ncbi:hypothetical protein B0H12DRAFT_1236352 [Mycena haematopus]|nr:hypothetical protein B0H12DRAFT_1236352 [Mycena haematopus]
MTGFSIASEECFTRSPFATRVPRSDAVESQRARPQAPDLDGKALPSHHGPPPRYPHYAKRRTPPTPTSAAESQFPASTSASTARHLDVVGARRTKLSLRLAPPHYPAHSHTRPAHSLRTTPWAVPCRTWKARASPPYVQPPPRAETSPRRSFGEALWHHNPHRRERELRLRDTETANSLRVHELQPGLYRLACERI